MNHIYTKEAEARIADFKTQKAAGENRRSKDSK